MAEIVVVGGFGSSPDQMNFIARTIGDYLGQSATGICFRQASQEHSRLADLIDGSSIMTHSGGIKPVIDAIERHLVMPAEVTTVAPPVREQIPRLLVRGAMISLGLREKNDELEKKFNSTDELVHHAVANFLRIPSLSQFNSVAEVAHLQQEGVDTTVALMGQDGLFNYQVRPVELSVARVRHLGGAVLSIPGSHCRFTHDPVGVLDEIMLARASELTSSDYPSVLALSA